MLLFWLLLVCYYVAGRHVLTWWDMLLKKWFHKLNFCSPVRIFLLLILSQFPNIFLCGNNEVKCAIIKIQKVSAVDDYEQTLNCKWPLCYIINVTFYNILYFLFIYCSFFFSFGFRFNYLVSLLTYLFIYLFCLFVFCFLYILIIY